MGCALAVPASAAMQPQADSPANQVEGVQGGEEIVVTAQKRSERLLDVPISISVLSGAELDKSTAEGLTEALSRVPGTAVNATAQGGATQVIMRGVAAGDALFSGSSPISYYLDSVPFGFVRQAIAPDANAYDLERVEVLRGPQGTLYGASAQNGVVRVLTKDADLDAFEIKARAAAFTTKGGGDSYRGDMAVNIPIIEGKLAARLVAGYQDLGGWIDRPSSRNANDAEVRNLRVKLNAEPSDRLSIGLSSWFSRADYGAPSTANDAGRQVAILNEPISTDFDALGLKIGYDFGNVTFTSSSSFLNYKNSSFRDLLYFAPDLLEQDIFKSKIYAQEVLLNSSGTGPWKWSVGGMYRHARDLQYQVYHTGGTIVDLVDQIYLSKSYAVFGEVSRRFANDKLEITGGLRFFKDRVTSQDKLRGVGDSESFDALSPRVVLSWYPESNLTAYASYSEGFRSGFPQSGFLLANAPGFPSLKPDTLHNYEIGAKGALFNGRMIFDAALYYIDWNGVQQSLTVPVTSGAGGIIATALVNGESASGLGFEVGLTTKPMQGLELGVNFSWSGLKIDADIVTQPTPAQSVVLFDKGDRLNLSPKFILGGRAAYSWSLGGSGLKATLAASANYTSGLDIRTIDLSGSRYVAPGDAILITRLSAEIRTERWSATVFADNLGNENGAVVRLPFAPGLVDDWDTRVRPRTVGVQIEYRF
jgi:outer membrane receptor protein involved in Fe transport